MLSDQEIKKVRDQDAYGSNGEKIGRVGQIYFDDESQRPEFATVRTGQFGDSESFVPLANATVDGDYLVVPFSKDQVKGAPRMNPDQRHLERNDERMVYEYYGMSYSEAGSGGPAGGMAGERTGKMDEGREAEGQGMTGRTAEGMTRSEERLDVSAERRESGRARLRKYVVTEHVEMTVPVTREHAVVEHEPISEEETTGRAKASPEISEDQQEIVLHEEMPVVSKHTVPVERVRLSAEEETREEPVSEELRKERIETEGNVEERGRGQ